MSEELTRILSKHPLPLYFVHGPAMFGKTTAVKAALKGKQSIYINCQFYDSINPIIKQIGSGFGVSPVVNVRELVEALIPLRLESPVYLILDQADALLRISPSTLGLLCKLKQFTVDKQISVILVSRKGWSEFGQILSNCHPYCIQFPMPAFPRHQDLFDTDELSKRHALESSLLQFIQRAAGKQHNDPLYLTSLIKHYHPIVYAAAAKNGQASMMALQRATSTQFTELLNAKRIEEPSQALLAGLSLVDQYMLLACYLASSIHPRNDIKVFHREVCGKKRNMSAKQTSAAAVKIFKRKNVLLERLLAIFVHIFPVDFRLPSKMLLMGSVKKLCDLRLILRLTPIVKIDSLKFKSNLSGSMMSSLCQATHFKIGPYLAFE